MIQYFIYGWFLIASCLYCQESKDIHLSQTREDGIRDFFEEHLVDLLRTVLGDSIFDLSGYYCYPSNQGVCGSGELNNKVRITLINGILNFPEHHAFALETFSSTHANMNIHYIFRSSDGWTRDMVRCVFSKIGFISEQAEWLAILWKILIEEMGGINGGGTIIHYAHSIGGSDTDTAKKLLSPEEQKMIRVITLGSPTLINEGGFQSVINYTSRRDGVALLDIFGFIQGLLNVRSNIVYVDTFLGIPLVDHPLSTSSYQALIEELGRNFTKEFLES